MPARRQICAEPASSLPRNETGLSCRIKPRGLKTETIRKTEETSVAEALHRRAGDQSTRA